MLPFFQQGDFQISGDMTPSEIKRRREAMARTSPRYGSARYVGEGLAHLGRGALEGFSNWKLGKEERAGRAAADDLFNRIVGGARGTGYTPFMTQGGTSGSRVTPRTEEQEIGDDAMAAIGKPEAMSDQGYFGTLEQQYRLPSGYLSRTAQIESGGNPNAQNPNSSAGGMFQFIDSTAQQYGLTDKTDPRASAQAAARLAADNAAHLRKALGREPTAAELYLAHQQGAGGAAKLLSNPNASATSIVGGDAVSLNGGNPNMTAGEFSNLWTGKFGGQPTMASGGGQDMTQLYAALSNPWLNPQQRAVVQSMIAQEQQRNDPMYQMEMDYKRAQIAELQRKASGAGIDPTTVQSSEILPNGATVMIMRDGTRKVMASSGELLDGQAAAKAIDEGQRMSAEYAGLETRKKKEAEQSTEMAGKAYDDATKLASGTSVIFEAIDAIDSGARAGALDKYVPNITQASASLKNAMDRMGLDVISATTFGALSEGELRLAMETAVPRNLDEPALREWLVKKAEANRKAQAMLLDMAQHFGSGGTLETWLNKNRSNMEIRTPAPPKAPNPATTESGGPDIPTWNPSKGVWE